MCAGIGVHSARSATLRLKPAPAEFGIAFVRTDLDASAEPILATARSVTDTMLGTTIGNARGDTVATIEHLMAAFRGVGLDNVLVEIDGPEVPIMDGSATVFCELIEAVGLREQSALRRSIRITSRIDVEMGEKSACLLPNDADGLSLKACIDFPSEAIGVQTAEYCLETGVFSDDLGFARTFGFSRDVEMLRARGLARGGSLDNAIVIDGDRVMNPDGLRCSDEFVRHKLLDAIGDLALAGAPIIGRYEAYQPGHALNQTLVRKLLETPSAWCWDQVSAADIAVPATQDREISLGA